MLESPKCSYSDFYRGDRIVSMDPAAPLSWCPLNLACGPYWADLNLKISRPSD